MIKSDTFFWFVAQTGQLHDKPPTGNYYAYRIKVAFMREVEEILTRATIGFGGFTYPSSDLLRLEELDEDRDRGTGRSNKLARRS